MKYKINTNVKTSLEAECTSTFKPVVGSNVEYNSNTGMKTGSNTKCKSNTGMKAKLHVKYKSKPGTMMNTEAE